KCLQKEPDKRYRSAEALAEDLERWLNGEPIQARPSTAWERTVKWARRRPALTALLVVSVAAAAALLIGGLGFNARVQAALGDTAVAQRELERRRGEVDQYEEKVREANAQTELRLGRALAADGMRWLDRGNWGEALLLFAEAAHVDNADPARQEMHRIRFGSTL